MSVPDARRATWIGALAVPMWATLAALDRGLGRLPALEVVALAFFVAAGLSVAIARALGRDLGGLRRVPPAAWALGVGGLAGYHLLYFLAFRLGPGLRVELNLLNYLWPLGIVLLSPLGEPKRAAAERTEERRARLLRPLAGALAGFAGTVLLVGGRLSFDSAALPACLAALGAALTWSVYSVGSRRFGEVPTEAVAGSCLGTALVAGLGHLLLEPTVVPTLGEAALLAAVGALPLGASFFVWDHGCKHGDLGRLGALAYGTPLLSTLLLVATGAASPPATAWLGGALIVGGAMVAARR